jgi:hypothetical protein
MHDFLLFWWDLLALNTRKTWFRLRGGRGRRPCQAPGDSGKAHETHCEAHMLWNSPRRFQRVCPALQWSEQHQGWRCSVDTADVRPYWGRVVLCYAVALVVGYAALTLLAFGALRAAGMELKYTDVAWPPAWRHFDSIRANHYYQKGRTAVAAGRIAEANLSLTLAHELDPTNYEAGFMLAQLWEAGQDALSDRVFAQLLQSHPARAAATARAWGRALLRRGDFAQLARVARGRLTAGSPESAWLHALIFSARMLDDPAPLATMAALPELPNEMRALLQLEMRALSGEAAAVAQILLAPLTDDASSYARLYQISFLKNSGQAARALELLARYGDKLAPDERVRLTLDALAVMDQAAERRRQIGALLQANSLPQIYEIIGTHLVRQPDRALLREVAVAWSRNVHAETEAGLTANAALLCAAAMTGDVELFERLRGRVREASGVRSVMLERLGDYLNDWQSRRSSRPPPPQSLLPALPTLPLDAVYALFERAAAEARRQP